MKSIIHIAFVFIILTGFYSCQDKIEDSYIVNEPVYMSYDALRTSFKVKKDTSIIQPGKIYFKDNFIFVNEYQKGIHIINNSDPSNPDVIYFLEIPGNIDLAIKGNILYADSYVDLVSIDISNLNDIKEVDRDTNALPYVIPKYEDGILGQVDQNKGVIIRYDVIEKTEKRDPNEYNYPMIDFWSNERVMFDAASAKGVGGTPNSNSGTGGSMAKFTLYNNYLYIVDQHSLKLFDISTKENPVFDKSIYVGRNIETIFPYEEKLFIGSQSGMYIYSILDPEDPEYVSEFRHASACDPVVVEGNYVYVTLRGGNLCGAIESQLDVIDISSIQYPKFIKSYAMEEPYGLGIDKNILFVCDGNAGLKIYDAADKMNIDSNQLATYPEVNAFDVIPLGDVLLMIGVDGLYQYDYSKVENIKQLSFIPIYDN